MVTVNLDVCIFFIISLSVFLRMSNILHNVSTEYQNTQSMFNNFAESHAVYEIIWKIWHSKTSHRLMYNKAHAFCTVFPRQKWLH
jgi:uncharacterized membrane protein YbaN (DUF454 family)